MTHHPCRLGTLSRGEVCTVWLACSLSSLPFKLEVLQRPMLHGSVGYWSRSVKNCELLGCWGPGRLSLRPAPAMLAP